MPMPSLKEPPRFASRFWGLMKGVTTSVVLFGSLLVINVLQTSLLLIKPFSSIAFRKLNREIANFWWGWCDSWVVLFFGLKVTFSGDDPPARENALVLPNHQEMTDIVVMFNFAHKKSRLGDMKWFAKDIIKYVPGVGWGMLFLDCLFVRRDWTRDQAMIKRVFENISKYRIPLWLLTFVEGTRAKPEKIRQSRKYAEKAGMPPLEHLLTPRTKGFVATVENLSGHLDAVYDVTIGYIDGVPTLWQWIKGYVKEVNVHVRRYEMKDLPEGDEALSKWLHTRYEEKDAILSAYFETGVFPKSGALPENDDSRENRLIQA